MKKIAIVLAGLAVAVAGTGTAQAQRESRVTGSKLLNLCSATNASNCDAYLSGVADAVAAQGPEHAPFCIPDAVTGHQLHEVAVKFMHEHPQELELKAGTVATHAFTAAFACKK